MMYHRILFWILAAIGVALMIKTKFHPMSFCFLGAALIFIIVDAFLHKDD